MVFGFLIFFLNLCLYAFLNLPFVLLLLSEHMYTHVHAQTNSSTRQAAMKSLLDLSTTPRVLHLRPLQLGLEN